MLASSFTVAAVSQSHLAQTAQDPLAPRRPRPRKIFGWIIASALAPTLAGCGESDIRVATVPVNGQVSFKGASPAGAQLVFHPVSNSLPEGTAAVGTVKPDGSFQVGTYEAADGVPPGDYVITAQWFKVVGEAGGGGGRGPNVLPKKYAHRDTSPLKVSVSGQATELPPLVITP